MVFKLPLMVTSSKAPAFELRVVLSLLLTVPLTMVPPNEVSPPLPNCPLPPISSAAPVLSSMPLKFTSPPVRVMVPKPLVVVLTFRFRTLPAPTAILPVLKKSFEFTLRVPEPASKLPPLRLLNPCKFRSKDSPAVLAEMTPSFATKAKSLVRLPKPCTVTPLPMVKV